ncbi:unnamed protein product [Rhizophagus irregularis]|nr:unnamed protein product [Rhizophagus irregularis]
MNKIIDIVLKNLCNDHRRNLMKQEIYKLFISQCKNVKYLYWETCQPLTLFPRASISSLNSIKEFKKLILDTKVDEKTGKELSKALARNRTTINNLHLSSIDNIVLSPLTILVNLKKLTIFHWENYKKVQAIYEFTNLQQLTFMYGHLSNF